MTTENTDFDALFAESTTEVEAGGGIEATNVVEPKAQNARIHLGDGVTIDPQAGASDDAEDLFAEDESNADDTDVEEENVSDETNLEAFDWSEHKDELVTIKVNGQDVTMPLGEALAGSMRQADYTRKTQEIAQLKGEADWGRDMKAALTADPQTVIRQMAEVFGVQLAPEADPYADLDDDLKPLAQKLTAVEQRNAALEARLAADEASREDAEIKTAVQQEFTAVVAEFPDFDPDVILPFAVATKLNMRDAYILYQGRNDAPVAKPKPVDKAAVVARKEKLSKQVAANASRVNPAPTTVAMPDGLDSFADMFQFNLDHAKG